MPRLELCGIRKTFGTKEALCGIDLAMNDGEILSLLGPSGCGKTTLLRIIAGLEPPDSGEVLFDGRDMSGVPVHKRRFGLMFQDYALFPHMNVAANIAYGLDVQAMDRRKRNGRTEELLSLVGLEGFGERDVAGLSGGERQRVALARSLAPAPRLLMLDEPLAALDRALRDHLGLEIRNILKRIEIPTILVTHDQSEAFAMSDRVAVLVEGRILQCDSPAKLYAEPASSTVALFLGLDNVVREGRLHAALTARKGPSPAFLVRPDAVAGAGKDGDGFEATVRESVFRGQHYLVGMNILGAELHFSMTTPLVAGSVVTVWLDTEKIQALAD